MKSEGVNVRLEFIKFQFVPKGQHSFVTKVSRGILFKENICCLSYDSFEVGKFILLENSELLNVKAGC